MAWLWESWEEYVETVNPVMLDGPGFFRLAQRDSSFETQQRLWKAVEELEKSKSSLVKLGFTGLDNDAPPRDRSILEEVSSLAEKLVLSGERLLLYHKRLATNDASYGFLHQNDLLDHWERYERTNRIFNEIHQLVKDTDELLVGFYDLVRAEERFLIGGLDLPSTLESDFLLARNLFSVGFDEVGLLMAGRGLEGVLRKIADRKKIKLEIKQKLRPASEVDFNDLIETLARIRWKKSNIPLLSGSTKALLHYLRAIRNSGAHPGTSVKSGSSSSRETATLVAENANHLWNQIALNKAKFDSATVQKTW